MWIAGTTIVVAGAQVVTTRAAAERRAVTKLNFELVENTSRVRELEAELRTRAGLPELQRWNDAVFQLAAPQGGQILRSPVQLASFAARPDAAPTVQFAVAEIGRAAPGSLPPAAGSPPAQSGPAPAQPGSAARLVRTSFGDAQAPVIEPEMIPAEPQDGEA
ncbi:MAG: hypothetical protein B7Y82_05900 [Sphingomonadales bacterium 32-65-25]|nr:MAG: hypothetical protein B7Y82_05900 [Sphingomonadales bacterium 32-65-25]